MPDFTQSIAGVAALGVFITAYVLVIFEEGLHLRKSKPVVLAAGLIWLLAGIAYLGAGHQAETGAAAREAIESYAELFLFLLVSIAYVNVLEERRVFDVLRARILRLGLSYRKLFWLVGVITFLLSAVLANMTTALVMGSIVLALGKGAPRFIAITCISIIVASNAGGAFSPFGDTTTLMVWQKGKLGFHEFFALFLPSVVNWLIPAVILNFAVPSGVPPAQKQSVAVKPGAVGVAVLFAATVILAVVFQNVIGLQPALGMMMGLGLLQFWAYYLTRKAQRVQHDEMVLDAFAAIERIEWDTMLFFFGVMFGVAGLNALGWLTLANTALYGGLGPTLANSLTGVLSAVLDNIPIVYAVLTMNPAMDHAQWLLLTLAAGVGGSLLAIGSAAGVALMGIAGKNYTFMSHLKWSWAIALGYAASIGLHLWLSGGFA